MKKKIMHVVECFGGGVMQSVAKLCHFSEDEYENLVVYSLREEVQKDYAIFFPEEVVFVPWDAVRAINVMCDYRSIKQLRQIVAEYQPDILHLHSSKAGALGRIAFPFGGGMKILYTPRAYGFLQLNLSKTARWSYKAIEWMLTATRHITVACGKDEYYLAQKTAVKANAMMVPNSVSLEYLDSLAGRGKKNDDFTVLSVGRICYQKNFPLFVEVARYFQALKVQFVWLGGVAPEGMILPDNVTLVDWVEYKTVIQTMAKADIYMQPSLWEGLSLTVLEAMGLGLPVLLSDVMGNKEMVDDAVDGYICASKHDYIRHIEELKAQRDVREAMGRAARLKIATEYANKTAKTAWMAIYNA